MTSKIIGVGKYIPSETVTNSYFENHEFMDKNGHLLREDNRTISDKLQEITGIEERRYASRNIVTSDMALIAAKEALQKSKIDPETLDYIIFAHNFGDIPFGTVQGDTVPSLASRVKHALGIKNNFCVAYDLLFGCPGWIEGIIQANAFIKSGIASRCLVIGAETLSRVADIHDRDSMIYADGAGAVVVEYSSDSEGILSHLSASHTQKEMGYLYFGKSYNPKGSDQTRFIKMNGRRIYEFAITNVPAAMKKCFDASGYTISQLKKIMIHQANEKMDEEIVRRFYRLYDQDMPADIMPMIIGKFGNSSVATIPTLLAMILDDELVKHQVNPRDVVLFASVGAGMNINTIVYRF